MAKLQILDFSIYRFRYAVGYALVAIGFIGLLTIASLYIPGGISQDERAAVVISNELSLKHYEPSMVVNLPYYLVQKAAFYLFGVNTFSIKLPSILLAFTAGIAILFLLKRWFKQNVAILTALIGLTIGPFLIAAQSGTPNILYILWPAIILLSATLLSNQAPHSMFWKTTLFSTLAISLYTPLSLYVLIALIIVAMIHPHVRHVLRNLRKPQLIIALLFSIVLLGPLGYSVVAEPHVGLTLLGIPESFAASANLHQLGAQYWEFWKPQNGLTMTPVYSLPVLLIVLFGLYRIMTTKYTAKSYALTTWLILLVPIVIISPMLITITFLPLLLLFGYGIELLIRSWYGLFPKNPYARVAGLIPLSILIISLGLSNLDRFVYGYLYHSSPTLASSSHDLIVLRKARAGGEGTTGKATLYVAKDEEAFYRAVVRHDPELGIQAVTTVLPQSAETVVVSRKAKQQLQDTPSDIYVNANAQESDRFYVYKKSAK